MGPYLRKTDRQLRFNKDMLSDIQKKIEHGQSKRSVAKEYGINESTLRKRLKLGNIPTSLGRFKPVFTQELEETLADKIRELDALFYGLPMKETQSMVYKYAEACKLVHPFNKVKQLAGKKWISQFLKRHKLALRQPEKISLARVIGFNKVQVSRFFDNLKICIERFGFSAKSIFNMDETGMLTVPNKTPKIISTKGKRAVGKVVSAERGKLITAVCCVSASGCYIPPALIYPRKREKKELLYGAPPDTLMLLSDSGFINTELFMKWLQHFKAHAKPSKEEPVLLILDNHASHISIESVEFCRDNGIQLLSLPPHTSHRLQPLDVVFFGPLKAAYSQEADKWLVINPGKIISQSEIALLFGKAYSRVASIQKAEKAFSTTGIWPYNLDIFPEEDFAPSSINDTRDPENVNDDNNNTNLGNIEIIIDDPELLELLNIGHLEASEQISDANLQSNDVLNPRTSTKSSLSPTPGCSWMQDENANLSVINILGNSGNTAKEVPNEILHSTTPVSSPFLLPMSSSQDETIEDYYFTPDLDNKDGATKMNINKISNKEILNNICPVPKKVNAADATKRKRVGKKSEVLTGTPFKNELAAKEAEKEAKEQKAKNKVKKQLKKTTLKKVKSIIKNRKKKVLNESMKKNDTGECPACTETYSDPPEVDLVQCYRCLRWFHEICTSYEGCGTFLCDFCMQIK